VSFLRSRGAAGALGPGIRTRTLMMSENRLTLVGDGSGGRSGSRTSPVPLFLFPCWRSDRWSLSWCSQFTSSCPLEGKFHVPRSKSQLTVDSVSANPRARAGARPGLLCPDPGLPPALASTATAAGLLLLHALAPSACPDPN